jgi:hypothetical protein
MSRVRRLIRVPGMNERPDVNIDVARLRPKFEMELSVSADEAIERIRRGLD